MCWQEPQGCTVPVQLHSAFCHRMHCGTCCMNPQRNFFICGEDYLGLLVLEIEKLMPTSTWQDQRENWTCQSTSCQTHNLNSFITNRHICHLMTEQNDCALSCSNSKDAVEFRRIPDESVFALIRFADSQSQSWISRKVWPQGFPQTTKALVAFQMFWGLFFDNNTTHDKEKHKKSS